MRAYTVYQPVHSSPFPTVSSTTISTPTFLLSLLKILFGSNKSENQKEKTNSTLKHPHCRSRSSTDHTPLAPTPHSPSPSPSLQSPNPKSKVHPPHTAGWRTKSRGFSLVSILFCACCTLCASMRLYALLRYLCVSYYFRLPGHLTANTNTEKEILE